MSTEQQALSRLRALSEASQLFAEASLDLDLLLDRVLEYLAEKLGDAGAVRLLSDDGSMLMAGHIYHPNAEIAALVHQTLTAEPQGRDEGLRGRVSSSGESLFLPSISSKQLHAMIKPAYRTLLDTVHVHSLMLVPLRARGAIIGTIGAVRDTTPEPYSSADLLFLQDLADRAALAIDNARLQKLRQQALAEQRLSEQRRRLLDVSRTLLSTLDPDDLLRVLIAALNDVIHYQSWGIYLLDESRGLLRPYHLANPDWISSTLSTWPIPAGEGIAGTVIQTGEAQMVNNAHQDARSSYPPGARIDCEHLLSVPLTARGQTFGVLNLSRASDPPFTLEEFEILQVFVGHFSLALANTNLMEQLRASEDRYRRLSELSSEGIAIHRNNRIIDINGAAAAMFGYSPQEAVGLPVSSFLTPQAWAVASQYIQEGAEKPYEVDGLRRDGSTFPIEVWGRQIPYQGNVARVAIIRDISERKHLDRMKRDFVSLVSHELRTPVTSIHGSLALITGTMADALPQAARSMIDIAFRNSERLIRLISDILDLEKLEAKMMEFQPQRVDARELTQQVLEDNESYAQQYQVRLKLEAPADPCWVEVEPDRLAQVLTNLLANAVKFSPLNGIVDVVLQCSEQRVRISVRDYGPGIPEEFRPQVFQKFAQSRTTRSGGTGLGLSISRMIVERLDGRLTFETEIGQGTTFHVDLPVSR